MKLNKNSLFRKLKKQTLSLAMSCKQLPEAEHCIIAEEPVLLASTSNVYRCVVNGRVKYIRLIKKHSPLKEYIREAISDYFEIALHRQFQVAYAAAMKDLEVVSNYKKIIMIISIFSMNRDAIRDNKFLDYESVGFPSLRGCSFDDYLSDFVTYLRGELFNYYNNSKVKIGEFQTCNANLQLATRKIAELFHLEDLIPNVYYANVLIEGKEYLCTIMDEAEGVSSSDIPVSQRNKITPSFVKSITCLEILDSICYQVDHKMKNYNVVLNDSGYFSGVVAFDNDCATTFFPICAFPKSVSLNSGFLPIIKKGKFNRPFIDTQLVDLLKKVTYSDIKNAVENYLTIAQILCIYGRVFKIKKIISRLETEKKDSMINFDKLKNSDLLSLNIDDTSYGLTYLRYFLSADEKPFYSR